MLIAWGKKLCCATHLWRHWGQGRRGGGAWQRAIRTKSPVLGAVRAVPQRLPPSFSLPAGVRPHAQFLRCCYALGSSGANHFASRHRQSSSFSGLKSFLECLVHRGATASNASASPSPRLTCARPQGVACHKQPNEPTSLPAFPPRFDRGESRAGQADRQGHKRAGSPLHPPPCDLRGDRPASCGGSWG